MPLTQAWTHDAADYSTTYIGGVDDPVMRVVIRDSRPTPYGKAVLVGMLREIRSVPRPSD
jgi:hypothetical protein